MVVFLFSHSYPIGVRLCQCFDVISLYLCFAWDCGKIPPPHVAYKPVQVSYLHLSNCKIEQRGFPPVQQLPCNKKNPQQKKSQIFCCQHPSYSRKASSGEDLISVCSLSSFIDCYYVVDFRVALTSLGLGPKWN